MGEKRMEEIKIRGREDLPIDERIRRVRRDNNRIKRMIESGEVNQYVIFTGRELCKINEDILLILERLLIQTQPLKVEGLDSDSEQS